MGSERASAVRLDGRRAWGAQAYVAHLNEHGGLEADLRHPEFARLRRPAAVRYATSPAPLVPRRAASDASDPSDVGWLTRKSRDASAGYA